MNSQLSRLCATRWWVVDMEILAYLHVKLQHLGIALIASQPKPNERKQWYM